MGMAQKHWISFLPLVGILLATVQTYSTNEILNNFHKWNIEDTKGPMPFELFVFTQTWPPTLCSAMKQARKIDTCNLPAENHWMIHGLWPSEFHTLNVKFCDKSSNFNSTYIASMREEMNIKWMSVKGHDEPETLWAHEWEKHGTCSKSLEFLNTEEKYFKKTLELFDIYNMENVLKRANILPGNGYSSKAILDGVSQVLGKRCILSCSFNPVNHQSYIEEIRICLDKSMNLMDCDGVYHFPTNCPSIGDVLYPQYPRNNLMIDLFCHWTRFGQKCMERKNCPSFCL